MTIRPYRAGDEARLVALFARVFGRPIDEAHWGWKLAGRPSLSPFPTVFVGVAADPDGGERAVHQFGGIPIRCAGPRGHVTAIVAVDAMTDPEYRRQGLLTAASEQAWRCWRDAGIAFVLGLPNEQWGSRAYALGWRELSALSWRVRPLRLDRIVRRRAGRVQRDEGPRRGWPARRLHP